MQKDERSYTFLLSRNTKSKISIRRIEVSKKLLHSSIVGFVFSLVFLGTGFTLFINSNTFAQISVNHQAQTVLAAKQPEIPVKTSIAEYTTINYDRPASSKYLSTNSGGPAVPFQLTAVESESEEIQMEKQLRLIEKTSNPEFLPTMWAHLGKINNEFGFRRNPFGGRSYEFHAGLDIDGERGDAVIAPANGIVKNADWQGGYGNMIEIDHGNGLITRYGHLSRIGVQVGDVVQRGQMIGLIGSTGRSTGPHLHFEVRLNDKTINPRRFLPPEPAELQALKLQ